MSLPRRGVIGAALAAPMLARHGWAQSNDWRLLDPAAQALVLSGKPEEARPIIERLRRFGYHAVDPLAASVLESVP